MHINLRKVTIIGILLAFLANTLGPMPWAQADEFRLPEPGVMVHLSPEFNPPILKGIKVHPNNPFRFDFILDQGDEYNRHPDPERSEGEGSQQEQLKLESTKLIKYFLASLTIPEKTCGSISHLTKKTGLSLIALALPKWAETCLQKITC